MNATWDSQMKDWIGYWQRSFDSMKTAFLEGQKDWTELFELQKDLLRKATHQWKAELEKMTAEGKAGLDELRAQVDKLLSCLNEGKASTMAAFDEQRKKIESTLQQIQSSIQAGADKGGEQMMQWYTQNMQAFHSSMEIMQLQVSILRNEPGEDIAELKKQLMEKLNALGASFLDYQKMSRDHLETWKKQMQLGYEQLNVWAEEWLKRMK